MKTKTQEMEVEAVPNPNQFWGAIKIFTEKPHVINRRICGTTNLWIGVCKARSYDREKVLSSILDAIESESSEGEKSDIKDSTFVFTSEHNINSEADQDFENTDGSFSANNNKDCQMLKSLLEINIENINSEEDQDMQKTDESSSANKKECQMLKPTVEINLKNNINSDADRENENTRGTSNDKSKSTLEINTENYTNSETDYDRTARGGRLSANIGRKDFSLIQKKLEDCGFMPFYDYDAEKVQDGSQTSDNSNNKDDDSEDKAEMEAAHINKLKDKHKVSEHDRNDSNNAEATARKPDHVARLKDGREDSEHNKNDEEVNEDETVTGKGPRSPSPDHREKISIPWGFVTKTSSTVAVIRRILPKQADKFASVLEVVLLDGKRKAATYITRTKSPQPSINPKVNYAIALTSSGISLSHLSGGKQAEDPSMTWLTKTVLPKVVKWASEVSVDGLVEDRGSLKLVDVAEYNQLYQKLKIKYGKPLVKMWPEVTDPLKFVYEDVAIATYLLLLWRQERQQKGLSTPQSFVDLGCGNGLLVYILSGEGHKGLGIDLKRRKIWDLFPSHVELKEGAIEPSDKHLFPDHDWLIGNHSDELTPWIPVMAAKSSHDTRFFVIPCCAHDFNQKYHRRHAGRSQYTDYLEYVREIGAVCGYNVRQDKLRIPSTKRICLVGEERTTDASSYTQLSQTIDGFIKARTEATKELSKSDLKGNSKSSEADVKSGNKQLSEDDGDSKKISSEANMDTSSESPENSTKSGSQTTNMCTEGLKAREGQRLLSEADVNNKNISSKVDGKSGSESLQNGKQGGYQTANMWTEGFKARESVQPVRNCTQLKRGVKEDIISAIVGVLMEKKHLVEVNIGDNETQAAIVTWDRGGSMAMGDLARRLDRPLLAAMKSECGGLQTLLKNHRYIFNLSDGLVSLQVPQPAWKKSTLPSVFMKTKLCWFHTHHRSGCPLPSDMCLFAHGEDDLRSKEG